MESIGTTNVDFGDKQTRNISLTRNESKSQFTTILDHKNKRSSRQFVRLSKRG